jgi:hypothetical protein
VDVPSRVGKTNRWFGQQSLDLEDRPKVPSVPPQVPPESGLHPGIKTQDALLPDDRLQNIHGSSKLTRFVLKPKNTAEISIGTNEFEIDFGVLDLDELERDDDEGLGGSENSVESSETREGAFAVGTTLTPLRNRSGWRAAGSSWLLQRARGRSCPRNHLQHSKEISSGAHDHGGNAGTHNLVARLGASSNRGGTRPGCHPTRKLDGSGRAEQARKTRPRYNRPNL